MRGGDVLVIGESLVDIIDDPRTGSATEYVGGSPLNVAVGLARLGLGVELLSWIGDDTRGQRVRERLQLDDVFLLPQSVHHGRTATATARLELDGSASYTFRLEWNLPESFAFGSKRHVHFGSVAPMLDPSAEAVLQLVESMRRSSATISYDPNIRPDLLPEGTPVLERVTRAVGLSDIVKASVDDLHWLYPDDDPLEVAERWLTSGPELVVITDGAAGSLAVHDAGIVEVPARPVEVVDTVGAGDAYLSGFLAAADDRGMLGSRAQLHELSLATLESLMRMASSAAALTVGKPGADPPTREVLLESAGAGKKL